MIYIEDQMIKLNGITLPGLIKSIEIVETAKIDEQEVEGSATKPKQATGYDDAVVTIEMIIDRTSTQTVYDRLSVLVSVFRQPGQTVPQPIPIVCQATAAHNIDKVIFKKLSHKYDNKRDQLTVNIELVQNVPQTIVAVSAAQSYSTVGTSDSSANTVTDTTNTDLTLKYQKYLGTGRGKSPARDTASTAKARKRLEKIKR